jgi:hypothetical protein
MGASGKRHIGAIGMTPQRVQGARQERRAPSPQSRLLNFSYGDLRTLFLAAPLPACHLAWHLLSSEINL